MQSADAWGSPAVSQDRRPSLRIDDARSIPVVFEHDGVRLHGERWGPSEGDQTKGTVVLAHGGGQTRHSWRRTGRSLAADGWLTIAYDARGHGDSDWSPDGAYTTGILSSDMEALLEALSEPVVLIGASMGGTSGMVVAGERPDLVRALVLVDVLPKMVQSGADRITDFMAQGVGGFSSVEEAGRSVQAYNPHRPPPASFDGLRRNLRLRDDGRWYWHWDPAFLSLGGELAAGERLARVEQAAGRIVAPTLVVRGVKSDVLSDEGVADFLVRVPHGRVVTAGAGHMVVGDDNSVFANEVLPFLEDVNRAAS